MENATAETTLSLLERIKLGLLWPAIELLKNGNSRYFWLYIVSGLLIAVVIRRFAKDGDRGFAHMFRREVWWSDSARNDYVLAVLRPLLALTLLSWALVNARAIAEGATDVMRAIGVSGTVNDTSALAFGAALTVSLFVIDDFLKWLMHTLFHRIPALWEFHKVHHSAEELNFLTAERFHPVEAFATSAVVTVGVGITNGVFIALAGTKLTPATVAGANIILFSINIFGGVLRHSPFWLSFGPRVERWIISPAQHQIHHSDDPRHFDRNMGVSLAIWDRLSGTLCLAENETVKAYGIGEETRDFRSFWVLMFRPFTASAAIVARSLVPRRRGTGTPSSMFGAPPRA